MTCLGAEYRGADTLLPPSGLIHSETHGRISEPPTALYCAPLWTHFQLDEHNGGRYSNLFHRICGVLPCFVHRRARRWSVWSYQRIRCVWLQSMLLFACPRRDTNVEPIRVILHGGALVGPGPKLQSWFLTLLTSRHLLGVRKGRQLSPRHRANAATIAWWKCIIDCANHHARSLDALGELVRLVSTHPQSGRIRVSDACSLRLC